MFQVGVGFYEKGKKTLNEYKYLLGLTTLLFMGKPICDFFLLARLKQTPLPLSSICLNRETNKIKLYASPIGFPQTLLGIPLWRKKKKMILKLLRSWNLVGEYCWSLGFFGNEVFIIRTEGKSS